MTEQEQKELELFKTWWKTQRWVADCDTHEYITQRVEEAWFARAKLDVNKPSWDTAPSWAKYLTQDSNGRWAWWENKPMLTIPSVGLSDTYYWDGYPGNVEYIGYHNLSKEINEKENL